MAQEQSVKYHAVAVKEFCKNKLHYLEELSVHLVNQIPERTKRDESYLTIRGRRHVEDKFRTMLNETRERVYLSVSPKVAELFRPELSALTKEGKKVVLITKAPYQLDGAIVYGTERNDGQIRLITDSCYALTGEMPEERDSTCLYSENPNLVRLLKDALANEIKLIQMEEKGQE